MRSFLAPLVALSLVALGAGCATLATGNAEPEYGADANTNLQKGNQAFDSKNYEEAEKYFEYVRTKYPFLDAAKEAEIRIADSLFEREQYIEARDAYDNFIKLHPTYPRVDYAAFRSAYTHYKEIPSDFFLLPPAEEKDQIEVRSAVQAMQDFLRQYPKSQYVEQAEGVIGEARKRLAKHEMYVADFYKKREKWRAVANRLETVARDYPNLGFDEEAYFGLYDAYTQLHEPERANHALEQLIQRMPGTPAAEKAKRLLGRT